MIVPQINGEVNYQRYKDVENRVKNFDNWETIGKDQTGMYDMYLIHLGDITKPKIMVLSGLHGTEWQGPQYTLEFMEMIRDNIYPDENFRKKLLENYHILYIPVGNPYGYDTTTLTARVEPGRYNGYGIDLNRDFYDFYAKESRNIRGVMVNYQPFAFLDAHLIIDSGSRLIVGNGQVETYYIRDRFAQAWENYTGEPVELWGSTYNNPKGGLARTFMARRSNPYTEHTLSYITEIGREADGTPSVNTNEDIYNYGMSSLFIFFTTSMEYFEENGYDNSKIGRLGVYKIEEPNRTIHITRSVDGLVSTMKEEYKNGDVLVTSIERDMEGNITSYNKQKEL